LNFRGMEDRFKRSRALKAKKQPRGNRGKVKDRKKGGVNTTVGFFGSEKAFGGGEKLKKESGPIPTGKTITRG